MSTVRSTTEAPKVGRPRSEECTRAIIDATLQELAESGYVALTIDGVAARSGSGKATIYRRWSTKAELVADAIDQHTFAELPMDDTGDLETDLRRYLRALERALSGIDGELLLALTAERLRNPELASAFDRRFVDERRTWLRGLLRSAIDRGELPPATDVELLADVGPALYLHAFVHGGRTRLRGLADRIVTQFFGLR
jgi:AcrR family transcriptional regulator